MQQNCVETLQSNRESLKQELSLLVVGRDKRDSDYVIIIIIIINVLSFSGSSGLAMSQKYSRRLSEIQIGCLSLRQTNSQSIEGNNIKLL